MILPTKHLHPDRALITMAGRVLRALTEPRTVSQVWEELRRSSAKDGSSWLIPWDWFVLTLDLLHLMGAVTLDDDGLLVRSPR